MENVFEILRDDKRHSTPANERLLSVADVAKWFGVSESWVREHGSRRKVPHLPAIRMGGLLKFKREDMREWLVEQKIAA